MDDEGSPGPLPCPVPRVGDRAGVLAAARNILARHHGKVSGGSAPRGAPDRATRREAPASPVNAPAASA